MEKKVKCRKDHVCACCEQIITKGQYANFMSIKTPRFGELDEQIGIEYYRCWLHIDPDVCDNFFKEGCKDGANDSEHC
jgi:hypothetical protein